jgi:hypothetical protein
MRPSKPLAATWPLEHGGAVTVPRPRGTAICFARRTRELLRPARPVSRWSVETGAGRASMAKVVDTEAAEDHTEEVS